VLNYLLGCLVDYNYRKVWEQAGADSGGVMVIAACWILAANPDCLKGC